VEWAARERDAANQQQTRNNKQQETNDKKRQQRKTVNNCGNTNNKQTMKTNTLENQMKRRASRSKGVLALLTASVIFATAGLAQMPPSP